MSVSKNIKKCFECKTVLYDKGCAPFCPNGCVSNGRQPITCSFIKKTGKCGGNHHILQCTSECFNCGTIRRIVPVKEDNEKSKMFSHCFKCKGPFITYGGNEIIESDLCPLPKKKEQVKPKAEMIMTEENFPVLGNAKQPVPKNGKAYVSIAKNPERELKRLQEKYDNIRMSNDVMAIAIEEKKNLIKKEQEKLVSLENKYETSKKEEARTEELLGKEVARLNKFNEEEREKQIAALQKLQKETAEQLKALQKALVVA